MKKSKNLEANNIGILLQYSNIKLCANLNIWILIDYFLNWNSKTEKYVCLQSYHCWFAVKTNQDEDLHITFDYSVFEYRYRIVVVEYGYRIVVVEYRYRIVVGKIFVDYITTGSYSSLEFNYNFPLSRLENVDSSRWRILPSCSSTAVARPVLRQPIYQLSSSKTKSIILIVRCKNYYKALLSIS